MSKYTLVCWLSRRLDSCQKVVSYIALSLDERLSLHNRIALKFHIFLCSHCVHSRKRLGAILKILRSHQDEIEGPDADMSVRLPLETKERIKKNCCRPRIVIRTTKQMKIVAR